ncbi:MAG: acyl-CoA dehydrogenase family protein [Deltaproteobacteria bacterium]|jgi:cyclohexane-1-carbonyl-CoA dehydrogenase|nr:acyl-CoA dehydrogenase family protein [Deltaproteobacteria bacterium]MDP2968442.1 acyl-CoA dehydrogenase family protein [Deltaproteobacteria bacterium]
MFDPISLIPTEALRAFRDRIHRVAREKIGPQASRVDEKEVFNRETESLLWDLGLLTLIFPEEYGGVGKGRMVALCIAVEEIAKFCASSALLLIIQAVGSFPVVHYGAEDLKRKYLPQMSKGRKLVAYLVTEPSAGSDVAGIRTTAKRVGDHFLLNGSKCFATSGGVAGIYSILAGTSEDKRKSSFFLVEREFQGLSIGRTERKLGQRGSNTTEVFLDNVKVPAENLLGHEGDGFLIAMKDFDMSRPAIAAQALGIAEGALEVLLQSIREKQSLQKPIRDYPIIQAILADSAILIEASRGLIYRAAILNDEERSNTKLASMAKCFASDAAMKITAEVIDALHILDGYGSSQKLEAERMFRDAKLTQIFEGTNQIQRLVIARQILKEWI